ncbi:RNA-directed DNA polymerase [Myxococcota bacterium]|nr:RNA-directed DNA polymerase [Myxococcota bacterium]
MIAAPGFDDVVSVDNVWRAWRDFERGKRRRPDVAAFALDADRHVHRLARELASGAWHPGPYRLLRITDPKRRIVAAATVRDRVVHHAIHRVLAPRWDRSFLDQSYACLVGKGSHRAVLRFLGELRRYRFVLQLDVRRYFYSIDREILRTLVYGRAGGADLRALLDQVVDSGGGLYRRRDVWSWLGWEGPGEPGRGLPIGNLTSQWWGNLYLDGADHYAKRVLGVASYQRYMDDMALFGDDAAALVEARDALGRWLGERRRLELKDPDARPVRADRDHAYLGYRVSRRGLEIGRKARDRLGAVLAAHVGDPERLRAAASSSAAAWMFG